MKNIKAMGNALINKLRKYEIYIFLTIFCFAAIIMFHLKTMANVEFYYILLLFLGLTAMGFLYIKACIHKKTALSTTLSKIDLIKIIDILYEEGHFKDHSKKEVMKRFGNVVGFNLENYQKNLNDHYDKTNEETVLAIFNKMNSAVSTKYSKRLENKRK